MHILKVGFSYRTAPIEIREKLTFSDKTIEQAMIQLNNAKSILENVIISTCNRTEIYVVVDQVHTGRYYVKQFISDWFEIKKEDFSPFLQIAENDHAIEHLFRVSAGLNSMVLGETQILGQVRDAFLKAQSLKSTGTIFNELFKQAITFAKRVHKETMIGQQAVSISYAAVELAKKIFGDLQNKHVVILGAGEMGELTARNLNGSGVTNITVINRTFARAEKLAERLQANAEEAANLLPILKDADILISATTSESMILSKKELISIQKKRKGNPLFLVDIAVPRDLDPKIAELDSVFLYDIDDLQHVVDENLASRKEAAEAIELMIESEISTFKDWVTTLGVVPVISALRDKALSIQTETLNSMIRKIPDLTDREKKVLNKHTKSIINQLLKEPINQAKELASKEDSIESLSLFINIFGIDEKVKSEVTMQINKGRSLNRLNKIKKVSFPIVGKIINN